MHVEYQQVKLMYELNQESETIKLARKNNDGR